MNYAKTVAKKKTIYRQNWHITKKQDYNQEKLRVLFSKMATKKFLE